jgi:CheY-like chemotaxis protein
MYRILVVEDIPETQEGMVMALTDRDLGWTVEAASAISEAKVFIARATEEDSPYAVVILDYYLPEEVGQMPGPSLQLTEYALAKLPDALVIQMTAFEDDEELKEKLLRPSLEHPDRRIVFVPKGPHFVARIAQVAVQRVLGDPIEDQLDDMFGPEQSLHSGRRARTASVDAGVSLTHRLADLRGRIASSWPHLAPELQNRIRRKFKIDEQATPVRITMF